MGIITRTETREVPDLWNYKPEYNEDGTEKHIRLDGARYHVLWWSNLGTHCSCDNCEINKIRKESSKQFHLAP